MELFASICKGLLLLPLPIRWRWAGLVPLAVLAAAMEAAGAAVVFGLIKIMSDPGAVSNLQVARAISEFLPARDDRGIILSFTVLVAFFYVFKNVFLALVEFARSRVTSRSQVELSRRMLEGYLALPYVFHLRRNSADLIRNTTDSVDAVIRAAMQGAMGILTEAMVIASIVAILIFTAPFVTLAAVVILFTLLGILLRLTRRRVIVWGAREQELRKTRLQILQESLGALKEVKLRGLERFFNDLFSGAEEAIMRVRHFHELLLALPRLLVETVFVCGLLLVVLMITASGSAGQDAIPLLGLFAYAGFRIIPSVNRILWMLNEVRRSSTAVNYLYQDSSLFNRLQADEAEDAGRGGITFTKSIVLEDLYYTYEEAAGPVLRDINLAIQRGESIGIVGPTGAGKSTLINLILGLLRPAGGRILVDGQDTARHLKSWQRKIGYVPQEVCLIDSTLRRNIAFGIKEEKIDEARIHAVLGMAQLDTLLASLPEGLDTVVGERGVRLSGGERQRVAIARALYHEPELIVFDEATSALDARTEHELISAIEAIRRGKTVLVVAHRLSTVRTCDRLVFLRKGRIEGCGTFEDLLRCNEEFRKMVSQSNQ